MELLYITFRVSGVETWVFIPPLVAFVVSFFTSMAGVSGAFILLPFQMSVLGYTAPSVSATNHVYNIVAIPAGVWRYVKEKRMVWPLAWTVVLGTFPGVFVGAWIRISYLPDPSSFKFFAGLVLSYIGVKLLLTVVREGREKKDSRTPRTSSPTRMAVTEVRFQLRRVSFCFEEHRYSFSVPAIMMLCLFVGVIGGVYGIGGGAIIAPILITFIELPVYAVAGAALLGTLVTSVAGVLMYQLLAHFHSTLSVAPDLFLGTLFGSGGLAGTYCGARCQKYMSARLIKLILCVCVLMVAGKYILSFVLLHVR